MQTLVETEPKAVTLPEARTPVPKTVRLGYLLSQYPAVSHTFLLHEVLGLRARGLHIETASINLPDRPLDQLPPLEAEEAARTHYIQQGFQNGRRLAALLAVLGIALSHPGVFCRGLMYVLKVPALTLRKRLQWLFYLAEALLTGRWMRNNQLTHLHVHFGGPVASVAMLTAHAWRVPFSLTVHGPEELLNHDAYHLREKICAAAFVLCISDFCRSQLYQLTPPRHWARFHVCRLGVDPAVLTPPAGFRANSAVLPSAQEPLRLVCTGRLVPAKGHQILLEALLRLADRGIHFQTTFIGKGPERDSLESFAVHYGLPVRFTSALSHPETLALLRQADVFALASFAEGVPVAFMEAMALGIPCVGTAIAGIPELIHSGTDGILVPASSVNDLADALESLSRDPALRRSLGARGRQRIVADYNLPRNHERLASLFNRYASGVRP